MNKQEIQKEALNLLSEHIKKYDEGLFQISRNKSMRMRYLWDLVRENYFGVFKKDKDSVGANKVFYPLTETLVWENVKNIDIDTKDVNTRANHPSKTGLATLVRNMVRDWMEKSQFGEQLNDDEMYFTLDGHIVKKKVAGIDRLTGKKVLKTERVDLRNIFKDQSGGSLQEDDFIERSVQSVSYLKENFKDKWINLKELEGSNNIPAVYNEDKTEEGNSPETDLYTYWGNIPKSWITGKKADSKNYIQGRVIASGIDGKGAGLIHRIIEWKKIRPYEEAKFEEAPGRWAGRGIGEKCIYLQLYLNTIYNVRRNNNLALMNQLFQFKEGSGITPEKMSKLFAGGAIGVQTVGDIARIDTHNVNFNESINEENNVVQIANRLGSSNESVTGESLPSQTPATNAIIQAKASKTSFQLRQERFGLFVSNLFKRQLLPDFNLIYKKEDVLRLMGEEDATKLKRKLTKYYVSKHIVESKQQISPQQADAIEQEVKRQMDEKEDLFIMLEDLKDAENVDISFFVTDETFDKATVLNNLQTILTNYSKFQGDENSMKILKSMLDILGLDSEEFMGDVKQAQVNQAPQTPQTPQTQQEGATGTSPLESSQTNRVEGQIANA